MDAILVETLWGERNGAVQIERSPEFDTAAQTLSDFVRDLPLTADQNKELIRLAVDMTNVAEHSGFKHGFTVGFQFGQSQEEV